MAGFDGTDSAVAEIRGASNPALAVRAPLGTGGSVITFMAGFAGGGHPHPPGGRTVSPAALR